MSRIQITIVFSLAILAVSLSGEVDAQQKWMNSADGSWSAGANWVGGVAPGIGDTVTIDASDVNQSDYWVTLDTNVTIDFLTMSTATGGLQMSGRTFTTVNGANLGAGKTSMFDSTWNTSGTISNGGQFLLHAVGNSNDNNSTINGDFSNSGTLDFYTVGSHSWLTINGTAGNSGNINFRNNNSKISVLTINDTNPFSNTGVIKAFAATAGNAGPSYVRANSFSNAGQVVNESGASMAFDTIGATYMNNGIFSGTDGGFSFANLAAFDNEVGGNMQATAFAFDGQNTSSLMSNHGLIHSTSGDISFNEMTLDNDGTISGVAGSQLSMASMNYVHNGGAINGFGEFAVTGTTMTLNSGFSNNAANSSISSTAVNGAGKFTNAASSSLSLSQAVFANEFVNDGAASQAVALAGGGTSQFNGGLVNNVGGLLTLDSAAVNGHASSTINVVGDVSNSGTIEIVSSGVYHIGESCRTLVSNPDWWDVYQPCWRRD